MNTLIALCVLALLIFVPGCSDNVVAPIVSHASAKTAPVKSAPLSQTLLLDQRVEFTTPDGMSVAADLEGQVTYQMTKVDPASLGKELPTKTAYRLTIDGQGVIALTDNAPSTSLHKPIACTFSRTITDIVEDGGDFMATFPIDGTRFQIANLHLGFVVSHDQIVQDLAYVEFRENVNE